MQGWLYFTQTGNAIITLGWTGFATNGHYISGQHARFVEGATISKEQGYLGFTYKNKFKYKIDFVTKFNRELVKMKRSGEIDAVVQNFLVRLEK